MSYEIERKRLVMKLKGKYSSPDYLALHEYGSNNVIPRDYSWMFVGFGWEYNVIGKVCRLSADAESGTLKPNGKWVTAESYIGLWRKAIKEAITFEHYIKHHNLKFNVAIKQEMFDKMNLRNDYEKNRMRELLQKHNPKERTFFDNKLKEITIDVKSEEDVRDYVSLHGIFKDNNLMYFSGCEM